MHTAVGEERDRRSNNVDNTDGQGTALQTVAKSHQGISSLSRLRNKDASVITEHWGLSVKEVGGKFDCDGDLGQLLEDTTHSHAGVVTGTTGNEDDTTAATDGRDILTKTTQGDPLVSYVQTTSHGVDNRFGLLEDFLLHEVVELALHDLLQLEFNGLNGADIRSTIVLSQTVDVELTLVNVGDIIILQVEHLLGVLDNSRWVRRQEELGRLGDAIVGQECPGLGAVQQGLVRRSKEACGRLLGSHVLGGLLRRKDTVFGIFNIDKIDLHLLGGLHTDDQGRTLAGSNDFMGVVDGLQQQTKGTLELLDDGLGQNCELNIGVLVVKVLGKLGNALGVGLRLESETLALQQSLQFLIVGDNTIVNDGELPGGIGTINQN